MKSEELKRIFIHKETELDDPNINLNVNDVLDFYSGQYPELTNASVEGPEIKEDKIVYKFQSNIGTKG
jgi:PRTRC genetic system protein C|tara:strand:+ start:126 stop:329 length:204 start_codon:yes stop_codon:yes gene_type:complete